MAVWVLSSIDAILDTAATNGPWSRVYAGQIAATTSATANSGYVTSQRFPTAMTMPAMTSVSTFYLTHFRAVSSQAPVILLLADEYLLGTLNTGTNAFTDGVAMPSKLIEGASTQTATQLAVAVVSTALGASTSALTITYTNQGGTANQTATMTLPNSSAVNSAFMIDPHLATNDTGIQDVTSLSVATTFTGVVKIYGLIVLGLAAQGTGAASSSQAIGLDCLSAPIFPWPVAAADALGFYSFGTANAMDVVATIAGIGD